MDALSIAAASGLRSRMEALDLLANNIANSTTAGFKSDREFYNIYVGQEAAAANADGESETVPVVERNWTDFSEGASTATGNSLDLAINGKGFFAVNAPGGQVLLTRNGNLRAGPNGELRTQDGYTIRDVKGKAIEIDPTRDFEVAKDGTVVQAGQQIGQLQIASVPDSAALTKISGSYFRLSGEDAILKKADAQVQQGRLEAANSSPAEHAVRMVTVMREFEGLQRAISIGADMDKKAIDEVARVTS